MRTTVLSAALLCIFAGTVCPHAHAQNCEQAVLTGEAAGYRFGRSVSGAGDVDRDGYDDFIVGANWIHFGSNDTGRVYVYSGKTRNLLYYLAGETTFDKFGTAVSDAGDVNLDGHADVIVGAPLNDFAGPDAGQAYVYSGATGAKLYTFTGEMANDYFGAAVSGAGDVNGDGHTDVIVGAHWNDAAGHDAGRAYVYSGADGSTLYTFTGENAEDVFGINVGAAGDVDGDGYADLIVSAQYVGGADGRAYVFSGKDGSTLHTFDAEASLDNFGSDVAGLGDVNRDGYDDVIVAAVANDAAGENAGAAYVYSGSSGSLLYKLTGNSANDWFGYSASGVGDVNGDGCPDLIVGANQDNAWGSTGAGYANLYSGATGQLLTTFSGEGANDWFGVLVSGAGDLDRDGHADVIVGAMFNDGGGEDAGRVYVYDCIFPVNCPTPPTACPFPAEDVNGSGAPEVLDVVQVINAAFRGVPTQSNKCDLKTTP